MYSAHTLSWDERRHYTGNRGRSYNRNELIEMGVDKGEG